MVDSKTFLLIIIKLSKIPKPSYINDERIGVTSNCSIIYIMLSTVGGKNTPSCNGSTSQPHRHYRRKEYFPRGCSVL